MKKNYPLQFGAALALIALMALWAGSMKLGGNAKLAMNLITGLLFGYVLTRSRFGFAGGVKRLYMTGEASLTTALLVTFGLTALVMAGIHWKAIQDGAVLAGEGMKIIPGATSVKMLDLGVILGGFLFGGGMVIAGGCASGSLSDAGEGYVRAWWVMIFFFLGSLGGYVLRFWFDQSSLRSIGTKIYFPYVFGIVGAVAFTFLLLFIVFLIAKAYENRRKKLGNFISYKNEFDEEEKALDHEQKPFKLFSFETAHMLFRQRWSWLFGGVLLSLLFILVVVTTGHSWGVTTPFETVPYAFFKWIGIKFDPAVFGKIDARLTNGLLADEGTVRNIGIILGATISFLLMGRFKFNIDFKAKDLWVFALGGLMIGLGARLAQGCNAGALFAGIANFSLHGWGFLVTMTLGGIVFLKIFEGHSSYTPRRKQPTLKGEKHGK